jgi:hypothetical protein
MKTFTHRSSRNIRDQIRWLINDWTFRSRFKKSPIWNKLSVAPEKGSLELTISNCNPSPLSMIRTKKYFWESLLTPKTITGTIIPGSSETGQLITQQEVLLNIQSLGWVYFSGGRKK